ncbi:hypothetical protein F0562_013091 [Nyssa sinensis]|uniref:Plastocyanin-like domain-containing protein n=1 Tax=Nyssa sinensis TaxID=561372 RepID=A0A5J4ZXV4_9ASTE|nr:hypothetical protein F0562_013091 [Nyssa sinensis]
MNIDLFFAIAQHNVTVVGMDGNYLKRITTPHAVISPEKTMNVLLTANQPLGHYYMATRQFDTDDPGYTKYDTTNATAILEYKGNYSPPAFPTFPSNLPSFQDFLAATNFLNHLRSLASPEHTVDVPRNITTRMFIVVSMNEIVAANGSSEADTDSKLGSSVNNISFLNPTVDMLRAYYWNLSGFYTTDFPDQPPSYFDFTANDLPLNTTQTVQGTKVKMLDYNETVEIKFQGTNVLDSSETHPMHLHGYNF